MNSPLVKICGISDIATLEYSMNAGADFVGFVHFTKSPRHVDTPILSQLIHAVKAPTKSVVVLVNPEDELLDQIFKYAKPDYLQLHGDESPKRIQELQKKYGVKVIKAIGVNGLDDLQGAAIYKNIADIILFDTKAPKDANNAGGFGVRFDWGLLGSLPMEDRMDWMLSGGLSESNVKEAIKVTHASMVDVSSHVETPIGSGKKDIKKINAFIDVVKAFVN